MYLGKEAINAKGVKVYAMPRMEEFLKTNGPWGQLVENENISIQSLNNKETIRPSSMIEITPFLVPHRDEYSETVGYIIKGPNKSALFIPDIDKWSKWDEAVEEQVKQVDYAFLDATFFDEVEINYRDISQIPHPFVVESMELFNKLSTEERSKIYFIHLNHTNPLLDPTSEQSKQVLKNGYHIARTGDYFKL